MDYTNYSTEELAADHTFVQWANRTNPEAERFWDDWVTRHPEMSHKVSRAKTLVLNLRRVESTKIPDSVVEDIWAKLDKRITFAEPTRTTARRRHFLLYPLAAVMAIIVISLVWQSSSDPGEASDALQPSILANEFVEEVNTSGGILRVHLSDGSTVSLQNNSRLKYKKSYKGESTRKVFLTGEAFFDVSKDPTQPFMVHSGAVVTRVLGTSFWVRAADDADQVVVSVKTGKVSVYTVDEGDNDEQSQKNAVILLPNQQVTYVREQDSFGKSLVPQPTIVLPSIANDMFNFENTPIKDVFRILQEAYGIEIIFDDEVMNNCYVTAPLGSEPLFEKLKIICQAIGARYETMDAKVVISSAGC